MICHTRVLQQAPQSNVYLLRMTMNRSREVLLSLVCLVAAGFEPLIADGQCSQAQLTIQGTGHGGCCGDGQWDDRSKINITTQPITKIEIWSGSYVDAIRLTYGNQIGPLHGGDISGCCSGQNPGGQSHVINLGPGEYVNRITGSAGKYVDRLCFTTTLQPEQCFGGGGGSLFAEDMQMGRPLRGIAGASGKYLDGIVFLYGPYSQIDVSTFKYDQAALNQALAAAPIKYFVEEGQNTGTTTLNQQFTQSNQLTHTESIQLTQTQTSSTTGTVTAGFSISGSASDIPLGYVASLRKLPPGGGILSRAASGGGGGTGVNGSFTYSWTETVTNTAQQTTTDQTQTNTGWVESYALPGNTKARLVTTWKQMNDVDLPVTYDLVYYSDDKSEVCRNNLKGVLRGSGASSLSYVFLTSPISSNSYTVHSVKADLKPNRK